MKLEAAYRAIRDAIVEDGTHSVFESTIALRLGVDRMTLNRLSWGGAVKKDTSHDWQRFCHDAVSYWEDRGDEELVQAMVWPRHVHAVLGAPCVGFGRSSFERFTPVYQAARAIALKEGGVSKVAVAAVAENCRLPRANIHKSFGTAARLPTVLRALYPELKP